MNIGYIGLGKMGKNMVARLKEHGWRVVTYDTHVKGSVRSIEELVRRLTPPRIIWFMIPAQAVEGALEELTPLLQKGDIIVDGGNSFYEDSRKRAQRLAKKGVYFLDVGVSGGPAGARKGACLMVGGDRKAYRMLEGLFRDLAVPEGFSYVGPSGAGHFVKMVHNGIEYGMMQALAEGFSIIKEAPFSFDLREVARVYNSGSVIQSRLTGWLEAGFAKHGKSLKEASGSVQHTGEGEWTVKEAKKLGVPVPVIKAAFDFRVRSAKKSSYTGKILTILRHMFGGHSLK